MYKFSYFTKINKFQVLTKDGISFLSIKYCKTSLNIYEISIYTN